MPLSMEEDGNALHHAVYHYLNRYYHLYTSLGLCDQSNSNGLPIIDEWPNTFYMLFSGTRW